MDLYSLTDAEQLEIAKYANSICTDTPTITLIDVPELPYRRHVYKVGESKAIYSVHCGQLKLLSAEITALHMSKATTVLYIGAAPGSHIAALAAMFPNVTFHLFDCAKFDDRLKLLSGRVYMYNRLFLDDELDNWAKFADSMLFISDIRTGSADTECTSKDIEFEKCVAQDMAMQQNWVLKLNPLACLLKFRLPYLEESGDVIVPYLDLTLLKQTFSRATSTEGRGYAMRPFTTKNWSARQYESMMFYYNVVIREWKIYQPLEELARYSAVMDGLCNCEDCRVFIEIVKLVPIDTFTLISIIHQNIRQQPGYSKGYEMAHGHIKPMQTSADFRPTIIKFMPNGEKALNVRNARYKKGAPHMAKPFIYNG